MTLKVTANHYGRLS